VLGLLEQEQERLVELEEVEVVLRSEGQLWVGEKPILFEAFLSTF